MKEAAAGWEYDPKAMEFEHAKLLYKRNKKKRPKHSNLAPDIVVNIIIHSHLVSRKVWGGGGILYWTTHTFVATLRFNSSHFTGIEGWQIIGFSLDSPLQPNFETSHKTLSATKVDKVDFGSAQVNF